MELNKISKNRETAIRVMEIFEEFLDKYNITIPSEDREGDPDEARIYGCVYYWLEDTIASILADEYGEAKD